MKDSIKQYALKLYETPEGRIAYEDVIQKICGTKDFLVSKMTDTEANRTKIYAIEDELKQLPMFKKKKIILLKTLDKGFFVLITHNYH